MASRDEREDGGRLGCVDIDGLEVVGLPGQAHREVESSPVRSIPRSERGGLAQRAAHRQVDHVGLEPARRCLEGQVDRALGLAEHDSFAVAAVFLDDFFQVLKHSSDLG